MMRRYWHFVIDFHFVFNHLKRKTFTKQKQEFPHRFHQMSNKSSDSVDAILKQIKEITENDSLSTSSAQIENGKLIEDITVTSSIEEKPFIDYSNSDNRILQNDEDPELNYFLMKMSNLSGHSIDTLDDAANEFQKLKYDSNIKNNDFHFLNVNSNSLDDMMDMIEVMHDQKFMKNMPMNMMEYFPENGLLLNENDLIDDISLKEQEERINRIISQQEERNRTILNQTPEELYAEYRKFNQRPSQIAQNEFEPNEFDDLNKYLSSQNTQTDFPKINNINKPIEPNNQQKFSKYSSNQIYKNNSTQISNRSNKTDSISSSMINSNKTEDKSFKNSTHGQLSSRKQSYSTIEDKKKSKSQNSSNIESISPFEEESIEKGSSNHKTSSLLITEEEEYKSNIISSKLSKSKTTNSTISDQAEKDIRIDFLNPQSQKEEETEEDIFSFYSSKQSDQNQKSEIQPNPELFNDDDIHEEEEEIEIIEKVRQELKMRSESSQIEDPQIKKPQNLHVEPKIAKTKKEPSNKNKYIEHFSSHNDYSSSGNENEMQFNGKQNFDNSSNSNFAEIIAKSNKLENQLDRMKAQNNDLQFAQKDNEQKIASLQHENEILTSKISMQESQINRLSKANEDIQKVLKQTEDLMNSQSSEISSLIEQRNKLIEIIKTQNLQTEKYEQIISKTSNNHFIPNPAMPIQTINDQICNNRINSNPYQNTPSNYDESTILDSIMKSISSKFDSNDHNSNVSQNILNEICQLKESSHLPVNVRVVNIVNYLSSQLKNAETELIHIKDKLEHTKEKARKGNIHEKELLSLLQSELNFMSKLSRSTDLQSVLLYRPSLGKSLVLNQDEQNELTKHCVMVQKFIDDKIGFYSFEQVSTIAKELDYKVQNPHFHISNETEQIFTLMRTEKFEQVVSYLLSFLSTRIPEETVENDTKIQRFLKEQSKVNQKICEIDFHEIANLFIAQAIMNEILQNHIVDIQSQLVYSSRQNQKYAAQLSDHDELKASLEKAFKKLEKYHRKETRIQKVITKEMTHNESILNSTTITPSQIEIGNSSMKKSRRCHSVQKSTSTPKSTRKSRSASVENSISKKKKDKTDITTTIEEFLLQFREIASRLQNRENDMINFAKEVEELNQKHQLKYDKQKSTIQQLKQIVKDQQKKIQLIQKEKEIITSKLLEKDKNLDLVKTEINNMMQFHDSLRVLIENLMKDHLAQMQYLQKGVHRMVKQYQFLFTQFSQKQNSIYQIEKKNNLLKSNSVKDKNNFKRALKEMENQVELYQERYQRIEDEIRSIRSENERIVLDDQKLRSEFEQQKTELDAARTAIRANDIRFKSMQERYECEKKTLQSQLTAQMMKIQSKSTNELKNEQETRNNEIGQLISAAMPYLNSEQQLNNKSPLNIVTSLCSTIKNLTEERDLALIDSGDISNARKLLSIQNGMPISSTISELLTLLRDTQSKIDQAAKNNNIPQNIPTSNSNDWEIWAKRLINGVIGSQTSSSDEQLRSTLEEMILASVSQRTLLFRLQTFREEKKAFLKFDKSLIVSEPRSGTHQNPFFSHVLSPWRIILTAIISIRRMQHVAGCIPIYSVKNADQNSISVYDEDDSLNRKRKNKKRSDFNTKHHHKRMNSEESMNSDEINSN